MSPCHPMETTSLSPAETHTYVPLADVPFWPCAQCLDTLEKQPPGEDER